MPSRGGGSRRKPKPYDFRAFRGYRGPRFTAIPDEFLDHQLADLTPAETKVMLFLFRKTYGYRKSGDRVSFAQLEHGTLSSEGLVIDRGTGLSRATIWRALKGLQQKGLIKVHRQTTPAGDLDINYYQIREDLGRDEAANEDPHGSPAPRRPRGGSGGGRAGARKPDYSAREQGSFRTETTPTSEVNYPRFESEPRGGFGSEPTRTDLAREDLTLSPALHELALSFLQSIGYPKPAGVKRERTIRILQGLIETDGYSLEELRAACQIAASMGARGPELIPHVIGKAEPVRQDREVGERLSRLEEQERHRWQLLTVEFEALPEEKRQELIERARRSSDILAKRPPNHPLVRAAAIALLDEEA